MANDRRFGNNKTMLVEELDNNRLCFSEDDPTHLTLPILDLQEVEKLKNYLSEWMDRTMR